MSAILELLADYRSGARSPTATISAATEAVRAHPHCAITMIPMEENLARLAEGDPDRPLFGVPFVIKDNIDLAGHPTTAACPGFAYTPNNSAPAVQRLLDAGAIPLAKVNLDQFATGLVGTRSPFGTPVNPHWPDRIPGGSSSGSAVAVAIGAALFALGTDTAGSGRVPAAACRIVGLKPSRGRVSTRGVVPACRSLDCVSVFADCCHDAAYVLRQIASFDPDDPFSRRPPDRPAPPVGRLGRLAGADLQIDEPAYAAAYEAALTQLEATVATVRTIDYAPLAKAAGLLYGGPWVAERYHAVGRSIDAGVEGLDPTVAGIIAPGKEPSAVAAFAASYELAGCRRQAERIWEAVDALLLPTVPGLPTLEAVAADPVGVNTRLGTYTNFVNLLDCCAISVPIGNEEPTASVTLVAPAWREDALLPLAARLQHGSAALVSDHPPAPPRLDEPSSMPIAVVGAHMRGQPLEWQLLAAGAWFEREATTAPAYRLVALPGEPAKPGLIRQAEPVEHGIAIEIWRLPLAEWGRFIARVPPPLGIGQIALADGTWIHGFLCEAQAADQAEDITASGGWRAWLATRDQPHKTKPDYQGGPPPTTQGSSA